MSKTLIDKLSKMERDSILKNDERVAQSIFNLTKKSKEKEDNNLKFVQIKGLSPASEYQFKKLFNDLYTDITDAESAFVSGRQTQEKTYGLSILKKYNLLCQYITRVLKYNSMTQTNKDQINNVMDTALPHLNNILSVINVGYATLREEYGEPIYNDIPIYKNIKENIQSRIYSQISRETMKYEIEPVRDVEINPREFYEDDDEEDAEEDIDRADYEEVEDPEDIPYNEYYNDELLMNQDEPQYNFYDDELIMNNNEPDRLQYVDYEEDYPQIIQRERGNYPVERYVDYEQEKQPVKNKKVPKPLIMKYNRKINKKDMVDILTENINKFKKRVDSVKNQENKEEKKMMDIIREEQQKRIKEQTPRRPPPKAPKTDDSDYYELQNISEQMDKMPNTLKKRIIKEITDMGTTNKHKNLSKNILNDLIKNAVNMSETKKKNLLEGIKTGMILVPTERQEKELDKKELKKQILKEKMRNELKEIERLSEKSEQREMKRQEDINRAGEIMKSIERRIKPEVRRITTRGRPPIQLRIEEKEEKKEKEKKEPYIKEYQKKPENIKRARELRKERESKKVQNTNPNMWNKFTKYWGPRVRGQNLTEKSPELKRMYKRWMDGDEKYDF